MTETTFVNCPKHGEKTLDMTFHHNKKVVGVYCFLCVNELLEKHLKNYAKGT